MNEAETTCRFLQVWLTPDQRGHLPQYGSAQFSEKDRHNALLHIIRGTGPVPNWEGQSHKREAPIRLNQDANVYVSESDPGVAHHISVEAGRQVYMVCIEGSVTVNGNLLGARDAAELRGSSEASMAVTLLSGASGSHVMLIEMAKPR
mmetsp:Transcript_31924/g.75855  ORF Transcript_31924/g.75855 Transcript_31924/m.75855 type:complete len:148 (-) Transcript_31924:107-550(-)